MGISAANPKQGFGVSNEKGKPSFRVSDENSRSSGLSEKNPKAAFGVAETKTPNGDFENPKRIEKKPQTETPTNPLIEPFDRYEPFKSHTVDESNLINRDPSRSDLQGHQDEQFEGWWIQYPTTGAATRRKASRRAHHAIANGAPMRHGHGASTSVIRRTQPPAWGVPRKEFLCAWRDPKAFRRPPALLVQQAGMVSPCGEMTVTILLSRHAKNDQISRAATRIQRRRHEI